MRSAAESSEKDANNTTPSTPELSVESIRAALEKILASPGFANADRLSRFIRYVVEETLNGQTDKLKESLLGIDVFGRKPTYDPRVDAVVRTEAVKLRARLRDYYESEGREDEVVIDLPKGGYVPAFRLREKLPEPVAVPTEEVIEKPGSFPDWKPILAGALIVAVLAATIYYAMRSRGRAGAGELSSIAVLPFADLSPEKNQEYFCDGMTEEIIDALSKIGGVRVVARTSSFAFKGKQQDIREIGKKLNVAAVLEGSVRKDGNRLRVTAQLNSVADGYHLWSETYERELQDVFAVQDEISRAIVNTLQLKLTNRSREASAAPGNLQAYELYLQGRYHWRRWRTEGAEQAIHYFEAAIQKDPKYAAAYAGLAESYCWLGFFGALPPNEAMPKARQAAQKALALDDSLAEAHTALAYVKTLYEFDWTSAEREFKRAIQLSSGDSDAHFGYGITYLAPLGRIDESIKEMKIALELDPLSPIEHTYLALAHNFAGDRAEAVAGYKKALELDPNFVEARLSLANCYLDKSDLKEFFAQLDLAEGLAHESRIDLMRATGYAIQGRKAEALELLHKWENPAGGAFVRSTSIAGVYATLGDREQMYKWLDKALVDRDGMLAYTNNQGSMRRYRTEPRFIELEKRIGLPTAK
jgi:TolB-like protein/Tfp pilus assembly protein PilF